MSLSSWKVKSDSHPIYIDEEPCNPQVAPFQTAIYSKIVFNELGILF